MECIQCNNQTDNPKFCSRSCSATYNNKLWPKRKHTNKCIGCSKPIRKSTLRCQPCHTLTLSEDMSLQDAEYHNHGKQSTHALVRARARAKAKPEGKPCINCGYSKHVEVCHIKPVSSFPKTAMLSEINSKDNLVILCPNCHWEFDHGLLQLAGMAGLEPA